MRIPSGQKPKVKLYMQAFTACLIALVCLLNL